MASKGFELKASGGRESLEQCTPVAPTGAYARNIPGSKALNPKPKNHKPQNPKP